MGTYLSGVTVLTRGGCFAKFFKARAAALDPDGKFVEVIVNENLDFDCRVASLSPPISASSVGAPKGVSGLQDGALMSCIKNTCLISFRDE